MVRLSKLELQVMEGLWTLGRASVREIQETFDAKGRPAYTTVQTTVYRLEAKKTLRRAKKISNAHIFEATVSRAAIQGRFIDEVLSIFGGRPNLLMAHMIESGRLTQKDIDDAEEALRALAEKDENT